MKPDLRPYPDYKPSGIPWLGGVPVHWEVRRLRNASEMRVSNVDKHTKANELPVRLCNYVDVYKHDRIRASMPFMSATATRDEIDKFRLERDDVLITKDSETWNDIGVPSLVEEPADDLICGYHLALLRPIHSQAKGAFLFRALQSVAVAYQFHLEAKGVTRFGLSHGAIKSVVVPLPPLPEQTAITHFLDYTDRRIQRYIQAKQKLITLLEEQKQAIIHQAVTGQIDVRTGQPYPAYKDSGVEWLGEVPEHWERKRVKHTSMILRGKFTHRPRNDPSLYGGPYPFIQTGDVARANKTITEYRQTLNEQGLAVSMMFPAGTLVMTIAANIGYVALLDFEACFPDSVVGFFPRLNVNRDYLYHLFLAMNTELQQEAPVNTQGNLNIDRIGSRPIALPPLSEQVAIVHYLDKATTGIGTTISRTQRQIDLLSEYRTRLISDVVTGKLDVREAAARLPEVDPLETEADSSGTLEPTTELTEEVEAIAEGASA